MTAGSPTATAVAFVVLVVLLVAAAFGIPEAVWRASSKRRANRRPGVFGRDW